MMELNSFPQLPLATEPSVADLLRGLVLGLAAAMPIGPVNVLIARRALADGFRAGAAVGLGAVSVDVFYLLLSTLSFIGLQDRPIIKFLLSLFGMLFLIYLAVQSLRAARAAWEHDPLGDVSPGKERFVDKDNAAPTRVTASVARSGYVTGVFMTLLNPMTLAFWFTVVPATGSIPTAGMGPDVGSRAATAGAATANLPMMAGGVFIGTLAWVVLFSSALAFLRYSVQRNPARRRRWLAAVDAIGGVLLIVFALLAARVFLHQ